MVAHRNGGFEVVRFLPPVWESHQFETSVLGVLRHATVRAVELGFIHPRFARFVCWI